MANKSLSNISLSLAHLPTFLLIIGYPIFWLELYFGKGDGQTSPWAVILFLAMATFILWEKRRGGGLWFHEKIKDFMNLSRTQKVWIVVCGLFVLIILGVGLYAALLPPHLMQESDALNYHYTLPRQHLLRHSFAHIPWSTADLYLLPIDFSLSPYWFATPLPNKIPQFIFLLGLIILVFQLTYDLSGKNIMAAFLAIIAVLGTHSVGIQIGTAMLDLIIAYLFFAAIHSFLKRHFVLGTLEFVFFFWSKSFIPLQIMLVFLSLGLVWLIFFKRGRNCFWNITGEKVVNLQGENPQKIRTKLIIWFFVFSFFIGGPFIGKNLLTAGTPLFPFGVGAIRYKSQPMNRDYWQALAKKAEEVKSTRNQYGSGRSLKQFLLHLWLVAVPEKGVNNRYDYPLGLMYLLFVVPFGYLLFILGKKRKWALIPFFVVAYWLVWWGGTHQTRFLYIPLFLMYISVMTFFPIWQKASFKGTVFIALLLTTVSVVRAHRHDIGRWGIEVLREKDKQLLLVKGKVAKGEMVVLPYFDVAYARFPVKVVNNNSVFVLPVK